jgi:hypothetical protein
LKPDAHRKKSRADTKIYFLPSPVVGIAMLLGCLVLVAAFGRWSLFRSD